jgi:hypothetical protein
MAVAIFENNRRGMKNKSSMEWRCLDGMAMFSWAMAQQKRRVCLRSKSEFAMLARVATPKRPPSFHVHNRHQTKDKTGIKQRTKPASKKGHESHYNVGCFSPLNNVDKETLPG